MDTTDYQEDAHFPDNGFDYHPKELDNRH